MSVSWGSSFYGCRAVDMALGHKQLDVYTRVPVAVSAVRISNMVIYKRHTHPRIRRHTVYTLEI